MDTTGERTSFTFGARGRLLYLLIIVFSFVENSIVDEWQPVGERAVHSGYCACIS